MTIDPGTHELEIERLIAGEPEAVFDGFIGVFDGDDRPDWVRSSTSDLRTGGEWTLELEPPGMQPFTETRTIIELDRPRRLAYSMITKGPGSGEPLSTEVGLSFAARSGQTLVKLDQRGFRSRQQAETFEQTWPHVLTLLAERVEASPGS